MITNQIDEIKMKQNAAFNSIQDHRESLLFRPIYLRETTRDEKKLESWGFEIAEITEERRDPRRT